MVTNACARLYHACELTSCTQLPDPVMLTAAAFVKDDDDLNGDLNTEKRDAALRVVRTLRNELGLGGRPDSTPARSQATLSATDFDLMARNRNTSQHWQLYIDRGKSTQQRMA